ncbi:MAG: hypothetical protein RIC56_08890 [Pseudomonadales bacterium]
MGSFRLLAVLIVLLPVAGAPVAADESPYRVSKTAFRERIGSLALTPLYAPEMFAVSDGVRELIEAEVSKRFEKTKIEVLPLETYARVRATLADQIGGIRDAGGTIDPARRAAVWDHAKREMRLRHPVDGFAELSITLVRASFRDDRAEWDGVKQKVQHSGDGFALFGGRDYQGSIAAASFQLAIFDRSDELLYLNRGGIEVLQDREGSRLVLRDADGFFQDEKRLRKAVQLAFKGL